MFEGPQAAEVLLEPAWLHAAVRPELEVSPGLRMPTALRRPVLQPRPPVVRGAPGPVGLDGLVRLEPDVSLGLRKPTASCRPVLQPGPPFWGLVARVDGLERSLAAFVVWVGETKTMVERWAQPGSEDSSK